MLPLTIPGEQYFNEETLCFETFQDETIELEHSLVSIRLWESKWHKPYFKKANKTIEETIDYIRCMTVTKNVDPSVYYRLTDDMVDAIHDYMEDEATATWFREDNKPPSREIYTAERIYYAMIANGIPFECQYWHINQLLTLIHVCTIENSPKKKMSKKDQFKQMRELNAARKKALGTRG